LRRNATFFSGRKRLKPAVRPRLAGRIERDPTLLAAADGGNSDELPKRTRPCTRLFAAAHQQLASRKTQGKLVLLP
jgi:hypothetical protein